MNNVSIESLNPRHYRMLDLALSGWTNKAIAEEVGLKESQVSVVLNSPNFQHELALRRKSLESHLESSLAEVTKTAKDTLQRNALYAAQKLAGLLDSENEAIVRQSANDILDRTGLAKVLHQEINSKQAIVVLKPEDLSRIESTLAELNINDKTSFTTKEVTNIEAEKSSTSYNLSTPPHNSAESIATMTPPASNEPAGILFEQRLTAVDSDPEPPAGLINSDENKSVQGNKAGVGVVWSGAKPPP